jgi:Zn-dependent metalloprotease
MDNVTAEQDALLDELRARDPDLTLAWDEHRGVAASVRGRLSRRPRRGRERPATATVDAFLGKYAPLFGPPDLVSSLRPLRSRSDDLGWTHVEYQHVHAPEGGPQEIEIYGSKLVAHVEPGGSLVEVQSSCWREPPAPPEPRVTRRELRRLLEEPIAGISGYGELEKRLREQGEEEFPVMQAPRLVLYPWLGSFRLAWATYGYGLVDVEDHRAEQPSGAKRLGLGQAFLDATTGELFLFAPTRRDVDTNLTGTGLGVTPLGGPFSARSLRVVRRTYVPPAPGEPAEPPAYFLWDRTHARHIFTYNAACDTRFSDASEMAAVITQVTPPLPGFSPRLITSTDEDNAWDGLPTGTTAAARTGGQQPEVDAHFFCRQAYEWYDALAGGRAGWDDGQYRSPPVPAQDISVFTHVRDDGPPAGCQTINAFMGTELRSGLWRAFLAFFDSDATTYDYLAGSKFVVGHEYQHAITEFSFEDAAGNPGLTYMGWLAAVHEGLSDVFGGLFAEQWLPATEISPIGQIFRNIVFPRDIGPPPATAAFDANKNDHFADRNANTGIYARGTILAHCAFLMGNGGVHQRAAARSPVLIPVYGFGHETVGGLSVLKAARIWYRALTFYFSTHGALTGIPANDENSFRTLRTACVSAAIDLYGSGSREHLTTVLAFYAVGLQPTATTYGADVTFLRWGVDWALSRPYTGLPSPDWSSLDLFVNNGGASTWNALVNVLDDDGNPTQFENTVYCRVRNVGDQAAQNVTVQFSYAKAGTAITTWLPVTDSTGAVQTLNVGTLGAGQANFTDAAQNSPPAAAGVSWYIPPLSPGEVVDHFCLRAVVTSSNDVNPHNNEVQSNVAYASYVPAGSLTMAFVAGNPTEEEIRLQLDVLADLPEAWRTRIAGRGRRQRLKPGEERELSLTIDMPEGADAWLEPPLDGYLRGRLSGALSGSIQGTLTETSWDGERLEGRLSATLEGALTLVGGFSGTLAPETGEISGTLTGLSGCAGQEGSHASCSILDGCLRPWRRVNVSQRIGAERLGGITVEVHVVPRNGPCLEELPPTTTTVTLDAVAVPPQ